jgi:transaldolase
VETLNAYRDHGQPAPRLEEGFRESTRVLEDLHKTGIDLDLITQQLEDEGVTKFDKAYDQLLAVLNEKRAECL